MDQEIYLIKFGKYEHLIKLQNNGLLYLNNLRYFWEIEDEELRGDPFDCVAEVIRGIKVTMRLEDGKDATIGGKWVMRKHPPEPEKQNIFCMYALRPLIGNFPVDERNFKFGDSALILIKPQEFINRIESSLKSQGIEYEANIVDYVDDEYTGKIGPFKKFKRFAYQSEWRLVYYNGPGGPRQIMIGSIKDISAIIKSAEINKQLRVEYELNNEDHES